MSFENLRKLTKDTIINNTCPFKRMTTNLLQIKFYQTCFFSGILQTITKWIFHNTCINSAENDWNTVDMAYNTNQPVNQ